MDPKVAEICTTKQVEELKYKSVKNVYIGMCIPKINVPNCDKLDNDKNSLKEIEIYSIKYVIQFLISQAYSIRTIGILRSSAILLV